MTSIEAMVVKQQLRWAGHVSRMEHYRLTKRIFYGQLASGHRNRGAPKKRYKDTLKSSLHACGIDPKNWSSLALDREEWRHTVKEGVKSYEKARSARVEAKRQRRKERQSQPTDPNAGYNCCHCNRLCGSRIGLISHERACRRK